MDNIPKPELPKLILSSNSSHSSYSSRLVNTLNAMKSQREAEQISKASQTETTLAEAICNRVLQKNGAELYFEKCRKEQIDKLQGESSKNIMTSIGLQTDKSEETDPRNSLDGILNMIRNVFQNQNALFPKSTFPAQIQTEIQASRQTAKRTERPISDLQLVVCLLHIFGHVISLFNCYQDQKTSKYRSLAREEALEKNVIFLG